MGLLNAVRGTYQPIITRVHSYTVAALTSVLLSTHYYTCSQLHSTCSNQCYIFDEEKGTKIFHAIPTETLSMSTLGSTRGCILTCYETNLPVGHSELFIF